MPHATPITKSVRSKTQATGSMPSASAVVATQWDQARGLRALIERQQQSPLGSNSDQPASDLTTKTLVVAVTSGKGGVGKSHLVLNVGVALAQRGLKVGLLDASAGLGNLDLLCGLNGYWNLSHVVSGSRRLEDVLLAGPSGVTLIPGASSLEDLPQCPVSVQGALHRQLTELEAQFDVLLIDTGTGLSRLARQFATAADLVWVVTTPEPTAIADAYATIKSLAALRNLAVNIIVNRAQSAAQAMAISQRLEQTARLFLQSGVEPAGWVPQDEAVLRAVAIRQPILETEPQSPASTAMMELAGRLERRCTHHLAGESYFTRLSRSLHGHRDASRESFHELNDPLHDGPRFSARSQAASSGSPFVERTTTGVAARSPRD